jgi:hypothetical protein
MTETPVAPLMTPVARPINGDNHFSLAGAIAKRIVNIPTSA